MASNNVAQFATELKMPADLLLTQLRSAGVEKSSASDPLSKEVGLFHNCSAAIFNLFLWGFLY